MQRQLVGWALGAVLACILCACPAPLNLDAEALKAAGAKYDVRILRDTWGVPHVFGDTDAAAAYGLAYAHAEDDFATIQDVLLMSRGEWASVKGADVAVFDFMIPLFRIWDRLDAQYETDLGPEIRAVCEAYAEGVNLYAALHPEDVVKNSIFPANGKDIVAGFVTKAPFFFGLDNAVKGLFADRRRRPVSEKSPVTAAVDLLTQGGEIGSNALAVAPSRSADGHTRLAINSHQPWHGPVTWYEAHLHSDEGMDIVGGVFPGAPIILHGHNRNLGWAHTVNFPDLVDVYVLEMNPENENQYRFDGEWRDLEVRKAHVDIRLYGPLWWPIEQEMLWSVHGPVVRRPHGVYAIRFAGMDDIRQIEQWYRMGKARNFDEWIAAMQMRAIPSFNAVYADREGTILYLYNALLPIRDAGYDWKQYLPGNTSETLWQEYLPFERLPQIKNPASGFVFNCNNTPYHATVGPENARPEDYASVPGIETHMTNRAHRAMELFGADDSITGEEFYAYKFDGRYSANGPCGELVKQVLSAEPPDDPVVQEAIEVLRAWDLGTDLDNPGTAIAVTAFKPVVVAMIFGRTPPDLMKTLTKKAHQLKDAYGRIDVPWGEVNRLRRGGVDVGLTGGPDTLRAVYGSWENGKIIANNGDSYILIADWDENGNVSSRSIHQFGSATLDKTSPHYDDQSPLFARCELKPVWLDEADVRAHLEREYRPGEQ